MSVEDELQATLNWFANPAAEASAHAVIAYDGTLVEVVDPDLIAWHARAASSRYLGAELVQCRRGDHISDEQLRTLAWWLEQMEARYHFALDLAHLPEHKDIPEGVAVGKSDVGPDYSYARLAAIAGW